VATEIDDYGVIRTESMNTTRWGYDNLGNRIVLEQFETTYNYNDYGILVSRVTEGEKMGYDAFGNQYIKERYRKEATQIDQYGTVREERTQGEKFQGDIVIEHYETVSLYDERGTLSEEMTHGEKLDLNGMVTEHYETRSYFNDYGILVSRVTEGEKLSYGPAGNQYIKERYVTTATGIDECGTVREETTEGTVLGEREGETLGFYSTRSTYNDFGVLAAQSSDLLIPNNSGPGIEMCLHVEYEIDQQGNIIYTHVYDANGYEIPDLGGEGYKEPGSVIIQFTGEMKNEEEGLAELKTDPASYPENKTPAEISGDDELLKRKRIEEEVQRHAGDRRFVNEIATEEGKALPYQQKGKNSIIAE
ncbi:MAG: hypothetical protein JW994_06875, partial [Candidatus Omnitrophica bacterium]|nr:hypothetical protein [Candidatus Omnitrophota bacterium]